MPTAWYKLTKSSTITNQNNFTSWQTVCKLSWFPLAERQGCYKKKSSYWRKISSPAAGTKSCHKTTTSRALIQYKMSSCLYRKSHCGDKTVIRSSYLHNGISYTGKVSSLYWVGAQSRLWRKLHLICQHINVKRGPIYHDFTHSTVLTAAEHKSELKLTTDTPYLVLRGELWVVCWEEIGENWPSYSCTTLVLLRICHKW